MGDLALVRVPDQGRCHKSAECEDFANRKGNNDMDHRVIEWQSNHRGCGNHSGEPRKRKPDRLPFRHEDLADEQPTRRQHDTRAGDRSNERRRGEP